MPVLDGALELAAAGVITGADKTNREYVGDDIEIDESLSNEMRRVLYDPQTAGGMLIAIAEDRADDFAGAPARKLSSGCGDRTSR